MAAKNVIRKWKGAIQPAFVGWSADERVIQRAEATDDYDFGDGWNIEDGVTLVTGDDSVVHNGQTISLTKFTCIADLGKHAVVKYNDVSDDRTYVRFRLYSAYVKAGTHTYFHLGDSNNSGFGFITTLGDPPTMTDFRSTQGWQDFGYTDLGGGYYRVWATASAAVGNDHYVGLSEDGTVGDWTADGTETMWIGGLQIELHSDPYKTTPGNYISAADGSDPNEQRFRTEGANPVVEVNNLMYPSDSAATWLGTRLTSRALGPRPIPVAGAGNFNEIVEDTTITNTHQIHRNNYPPDLATTQVTFSAIVAQGVNDRDMHLYLSDMDVGSSSIYTVFDLSAGVITGDFTGGNGQIDDSGILDLGAGNFFIWITGIANTGGSATSDLDVIMRLHEPTLGVSYTGDGVSSIHFGVPMITEGNVIARFTQSVVSTTAPQDRFFGANRKYNWKGAVQPPWNEERRVSNNLDLLSLLTRSLSRNLHN